MADLKMLSASFLAPHTMLFLLPWLAVSLTLVAGVFHHRRLCARLGDGKGMLLYFSLFFIFFCVMPVAVIILGEADPAAVLASLGVGPGKLGRGLVFCAIALPVTMLLSFFASKEPAMREQYPFSKMACASDGAFIGYEASYLLLYYTSWEFLYRGLLFFPLFHALGFPAAAAISTALSTLHHIGHPDSEIAGAFAGGIIFCALSALTGSLLAAFLVHAMMGIGNDTMLYFRWHRGRRKAAQ
jgi:membrane protease YdiL (CAAX protease family)